MKVLMLGWEFPPHISGGLGTACLGLSQGLAQNDVEVTFVVPRLFGDEEADGVRLVAAEDVEVRREGAPGPGALRAAGEHVPVRLRHAFRGARGDGRALTEPMERTVRMLSVDSPLRPYMTEGDYRRKLDELEALRRAAAHGGAAPGPAGEAPERLAFAGGYGPDLLGEVRRYARVVAELARTHEHDVVHAHDWMTWPAGIAAAEASGRPLVAHLHACEYDRSGGQADARVLAVEQAGFDRADRVVCVSQYTAGVVARNYRIDPSKVRVVHNAVTRHEAREHLHLEKSALGPIVLFLGRITWQKGPDYFLEAAARVLAVRPDVRFVLSGTGDRWPRMVERAAQLGIAGNTHFTGFLDGEDVERMYAMADLYVMPSVSEPFGISPLEAMALDVPVIVSRQSGVAEVLTNALKVDFWDVEDIANKIVALLAYPALREELAGPGRDEVRRMSWSDRGHALRRVYEELSP